jgi:hypothetical protein
MPSEAAKAYLVLRASSDMLRKDLSDARALVVAQVSTMAQAVGKIGDAFGLPGTRLVQGIMTAISGAKAILEPVLGGAFTAVGKIAGAAISLISGGLRAVGSALSGVGSLLTLNLGGALSGAFGIVTNLLDGVLGAARGIGEAIFSVVEGLVKSLAKLFESITQMIASAVGAAADQLGGFLSQAMAAEARTAKINALLKGTGESAGWSAAQLDRMAIAMRATGTNSLQEIKEAQAILLRFTNIRGDVFRDAMEGLRQFAALMGGDMVGAAHHFGMALENPEHAMRMLRRAGMALTPVEQQMIKAAMASGRLADAQQVILNKIRQYGDVAGAMANTTEGQIKKLQASWSDMGTAIGAAFLPLVTIVTEFLQPLVEGISASIRSAMGEVQGATGGLLEQARAWINENRETIVAWGRQIGDIVLAVGTLVKDAFVGMGNAAAAFYNWLTGNTGSVFDGVADKITNSLAVVRAVLEHFPEFAQAMWLKLKASFIEWKDWFQDRWEVFMSWLNLQWLKWYDKVMEFVDGLVQRLMEAKTIGLAVVPLPTDSAAAFAWDTGEEGSRKAQAKRSADLTAALNDYLTKSQQGVRDQTDEVKKLNRQASDILKFLDRSKLEESGREKKRAEMREDAAKRQAAEDKANPKDFDNAQSKYEFAGFLDLWKRVQEGVGQTAMVDMTKGILNNTDKVARGVDDANQKLQQIIDKPNPPARFE